MRYQEQNSELVLIADNNILNVITLISVDNNCTT